MNLPNLLTLIRIFIAPLLVVVLLTRFSEDWVGLPQHVAGVSLFLFAAITDVLDGWIARRRKQVSRFGTLLDPIADKLLISAAFISLVENRLAPAWAVVVIIGLLITSSVDGGPPVQTKAFPVIAFWTVPEMRAALQHLFGAGDLNWLDWRVLFYGLGRGLLWLVVVSSCWSMYGYFREFYLNARESLGIDDEKRKRKQPGAAASTHV